ncbi:MAG: FAD/NAD(P)-binding protein [Steroidobacteraceae bacterium]
MGSLDTVGTDWRSRTVAIVGAGFSGTALAIRLLREPMSGPSRIVLIERSVRAGCGLAYSGANAGAVLNVPAARMSLDPAMPDDFLDYLHARGMSVQPEEFVARTIYGDYLEARLAVATAAAPRRVQLVRLQGTVASIDAQAGGRLWRVTLDDERTVLADAAVLATGHLQPSLPSPLRPLVGTGRLIENPWSGDLGEPVQGRVLLIGTGLTMADVACELVRRSPAPREIVAISRRGLLSRTRLDAMPTAPDALDLTELERAGDLRRMTAEVRRIVERASAAGIDWRDVMVALRERVPALWHRLGPVDRGRFLRHLQPYWDVHRHQLPPQVGDVVGRLVADGRLRTRAASAVSAKLVAGQAIVALRARGSRSIESSSWDRVIVCTGPASDLRRANAPWLRSLLDAGHAAPDDTGIGLRTDAQGRLLGSDGQARRGLYYVGPWLRARDLEATAVHELRQHVGTLATLLRGGHDWTTETAVA